jgi:uncharacterized protein (TIGR02118 family)
MIKVSVLYPYEEGKKFDMNYYLNKHIPMVQEKLGASCNRVEVDQGVSGAAPGSRPTYSAMCHLYFDSLESFQTAFVPHDKTFAKDAPNYSQVAPTIQISEVKM